MNIVSKCLKSSLLIIGVALTLSVVPASLASAQKTGQLCRGANLSLSGSTDCSPDGANPTTGLNRLITVIINVFSVIVGIVAVIMIIYGGLRFITSGGDSGRVGSAKNTVLYAIVGLIIVALAQFIVRFVISRLG